MVFFKGVWWGLFGAYKKSKIGRKVKCRVKASVNVQYSVSNPIGKNFYSKWKYIVKI